MEIGLVKLGQLLARCWERAETETAAVIATKYHAPCEEEITFLFTGELRAIILAASNARHIESAFMEDLREQIPDLPEDAERRLKGLIARVNFHRRQHESRHSAADLGVVVRRPFVELTNSGRHLHLRLDAGRGLLAQAKLGRTADAARGFSWGRLRPSQMRLIPIRAGYYSFLLYRLVGSDGRELRPLRWQLCDGQESVDSIKQWLRADAFPNEKSSAEIIRALVAGSVGTEDPTIIDDLIDPLTDGGRTIDIDVFWPEGTAPPGTVELERYVQEPQKVFQLLRR
jgi:hypothetical protein